MTNKLFRDQDECLQAWFEALGPMTGASSDSHVSGIVPIEGRLPRLRDLAARTTATRKSGVSLPLFDLFDAEGFDLVDRLLTFAFLRDSYDSRTGAGLARAHLCDAAGAASHVQQETVRRKAEESGPLRRLGLLVSDADQVVFKRFYTLGAGVRSAILKGETQPERTPATFPADYPAFSAVVLAVAESLLSVCGPALDVLPGWADANREGPGWDARGPRRTRLALAAEAVLRRGDEPLSSALLVPGIHEVAGIAAFLLVAARGRNAAGVPLSVLETALGGLDGCANPGDWYDEASPLVLEGLVHRRHNDRPDATVEAYVDESLFARLFPWTAEVASAQPSEDPKPEDDAVERITPRIRLDGVVLPADVRSRLDEALAVPAAGALVAKEWGLGEGITAPAGVALLFYGPPGTGKTLAAEAVAGELRKALCRVRIDNVLGKYVGQTEKAISGVFKAAAESGSVVLLDEADALLGDRANSERRWEISQVNVLLQEIERFQGVVILTTNRDRSLDPALERRLLARIEFAMPGESEREVLWQKHLPPRAPLAADVDLAAVARDYPLSGSFIRTAAFMASVRAARRPDGERLLTQADLVGAAAEQAKRSKAEKKPLGFVPATPGHRLSHQAPEIVLERRGK